MANWFLRSKSTAPSGVLRLTLVLCIAAAASTLVAQTGKPKVKPKPNSPTSVKALDAKAEKLQDTLSRETAELAKEYEDAGVLDKARTLYEVLLKLDPKRPGLKDKVDSLNEQIMESNDFDVDLDTGKNWSSPVALVYKDRPLRLQVDGDYRASLQMKLTADGFSPRGGRDGETKELSQETLNDLVPGLPMGAVIGIIVTDSRKLGKPFLVGDKKDLTPNEDGKLLLKVNLPQAAKGEGRLKVKVSGYARQPG